jgi:hypothetical protein
MSSNTNLTLYIILYDKIPVESHKAHKNKKEGRKKKKKKDSPKEEFIPKE